MNLGGDPWPIYLEPSGKEGMKGIIIQINRFKTRRYAGLFWL